MAATDARCRSQKAQEVVTDVALSMFGDAQKRANAARQCTAEGGSAIEGQKLEPAE